MFAQATSHVCDHQEAQHGALVTTVCAGWSAGLLEVYPMALNVLFVGSSSQFDSICKHAKIYFNTSFRQAPRNFTSKPNHFFLFLQIFFYQVVGSCYIVPFSLFLFNFLTLLSFVLFFREPPAFSHSVRSYQRKNAPCRDNKSYLKCDTVFQRMGGGGKKRRERGIVERR